jgi:hypothetical protein
MVGRLGTNLRSAGAASRKTSGKFNRFPAIICEVSRNLWRIKSEYDTLPIRAWPRHDSDLDGTVEVMAAVLYEAVARGRRRFAATNGSPGSGPSAVKGWEKTCSKRG